MTVINYLIKLSETTRHEHGMTWQTHREHDQIHDGIANSTLDWHCNIICGIESDMKPLDT